MLFLKAPAIRRAAVIAVSTLVVSAGSVLASAPAFAAKEKGLEPGKGLGVGLAILIYAGIPLGVFALLAGLIYGPGMVRRPRYRPGYQEWGYRPLWIGGPVDPDAALARTDPNVVREIAGGGSGAGW